LCVVDVTVVFQTTVTTTKASSGGLVHVRNYVDPLEDMVKNAAPSLDRGEKVNWHPNVDFLQHNAAGTHHSYFEFMGDERVTSEQMSERVWAGAKLQALPLNKVALDSLKTAMAHDHRSWSELPNDPDLRYVCPSVKQYNEGVSVKNTLEVHGALSHTSSVKAIEQDDRMLQHFIPVAEDVRQLYVLHMHHLHTALDRVMMAVDDTEVTADLQFVRDRVQSSAALFKSALLWTPQYVFSKIITVDDPRNERARIATGLGPRQELLLRRRAESVLHTTSQLEVVEQAKRATAKVSQRPGNPAGSRGGDTASAKAQLVKNQLKREQAKKRKQASLARQATESSSDVTDTGGSNVDASDSPHKGKRQKYDKKSKKSKKDKDKKDKKGSGN
jgi:hypothetical protein